MQTDEKIIKYDQLKPLREKATKAKKKIVFTTGCFDLLHLGHLIHLDFCKKKGDILIVSLGNDKTLKILKGKNRPFYNQKARARLLAGLKIIDYVVISEEFGKMDHGKLVALLKPDFYILPDNDSAISEKEKLVKENDGKLILCRRLPPKELKKEGVSTTKTEEKIIRLG